MCIFFYDFNHRFAEEEKKSDQKIAVGLFKGDNKLEFRFESPLSICSSVIIVCVCIAYFYHFKINFVFKLK